MSADLPSALFVTSCDVLPVDTIEKVFNGNLPQLVQIDQNITAYKWDIDNKYYTASINLCSVANKELSTGTFADSVEAIVIYFDSENLRGLELAETWLPFLDVYDPEIKILVCRNCPDELEENSERISKRAAQEWCIQRRFELVELEPTLDDIDPDDDFLETTGVERIRQALNAHRWPNLILKAESGHMNGFNGATSHTTEQSADADGLDSILFSNSGLADLAPDFASLFSQLTEIKTQLSTLTGDARKEAAERVVRDFWLAMGGDGDELDELQLLHLLP